MLLHEPGEQVGVGGRQPVTCVANRCKVVALAERRCMVAAAALGDVVEQPREVEHLLTYEVGDEPRAQRVFVRVLGLG